MATFTKPADTERERRLAAAIGERWKCTLHQYPHFHGVDFYAERNGQVVALMELKVRDHTTTEFPTVFLSLNKWLALLLGSAGCGVPAFYVVQFKDELRYINAADVYAGGAKPGQVHVKGRAPREGSANDREPIVEIPVGTMETLVLTSGVP